MKLLEGIEGSTKAWLLGFSVLFICMAATFITDDIVRAICK